MAPSSMNVTIDLVDASHDNWVPEPDAMQRWAEVLLTESGVSEDVSISMRLVEESESAQLNKTWRHRDKPTNVLSFPVTLPDEVRETLASRPLGDIVICPTVVSREAAQQNKPVEAHWTHLVCHGLLHLLGYHHDNENNASRMEALEIRALDKLGIANPYLIG